LALVFEPGRPDGSMVTGRRGVRRYRIKVSGRPAHTGVEPWNGVNAIEEAAHKILAVQGLNQRDEFLSVTVAKTNGGKRINIVPDEAAFEVDVRIPSIQQGERAHREIEKIVEDCRVVGSTAS